MTKQELENKYLNRMVQVIIRDFYHPVNAVGLVTEVDDMGQLHGTWGDWAAFPGLDEIELL